MQHSIICKKLESELSLMARRGKWSDMKKRRAFITQVCKFTFKKILSYK